MDMKTDTRLETYSDFRNVLAWQRGMELADKIYDAVELLPSQERFVLSQQMRDAALSVPANIAEGKGRYTTREYRQFVRYARGSAMEVQSHILFAERRKFLPAEVIRDLMKTAVSAVQLINGLLRFLEKKTRTRTRRRASDDRRPTTDDR
jgi:four helix bundle protein